MIPSPHPLSYETSKIFIDLAEDILHFKQDEDVNAPSGSLIV